MNATSLYVHVPFCVVKCGYCDFNSYPADGDAPLDRFLAALDVELRMARPPRHPHSVFIGGGTPSYLDHARFERLLEVLRQHVDLQGCPEVSMEANPESIDRRKAELAMAAGVRRFSMGAQSFDGRHLRTLDRAHDPQRVHAAVAELRDAGVDNLGLDLIFSVPGQTLAEWKRDLDIALALEPDHLSCYALVFEPGTRLHRELTRGHIAPNDPELERAMFQWTRERLHDAGFVAYEISNFAGRGGICRHNDHYWLQGDYVGVGPGASSHRQGVRWSNLKPLESWCDSLTANLPPVAEAETLTPRQRAAEALWLGLRRRDGVDLAAVAARTGIDPRQRFAAILAEAGEQGWLRSEGPRILLAEDGVLVSDEIGRRILQAP